MKIEQTPSPNFNERKSTINMLVLHYTGMDTGAAALQRMCDSAAAVSAHYMIWEDGRISQLVDETKRAWHAGVGSWQSDTDLNSCSIGIEIVNGGHNVPLEDGSLPPYPVAQIEALVALATWLVDRHGIPASRIVGHSDIAPMRKTDPGEHFPWHILAEHGLGLWPMHVPAGDEVMGRGLATGDKGAPVERLQAALQQIGYGIEVSGLYDSETEAVLKAFQRRWQPARVTGQAGWVTIALVAAVAELSD